MSHSYAIKTNQKGPHLGVADLVQKHFVHDFLRPYPSHQLQSFKLVDEWVKKIGRPVILDSGCGTGRSTVHLAQQFPSHAIVGIDKSADRLNKNIQGKYSDLPSNYFFTHGNLEDIWRLISVSNWPVTHHFILYPNPWPKSEHLKRRWHGHPVFPTLIRLSPYLELRSNWKTYLEEFSIATLAATGILEEPIHFLHDEASSSFEEKYWQSGCPTYQLSYRLNDATHRDDQCSPDSAY